jgi:hypothetical protein
MVIMAEDNSSSTIEPTEPTQNGDGGTEPQGAGAPAADTTDWKAEARKWEKRAKANAKQQDSNKTADDEIASIRAELEAMKAERDQKAWLDEVSKETGVSADLIRGATKEEMKAHAEAIAKAYKKPSAPSGQSDTRKGGDGNGPKMTKQEILAIKNSKERKAAIAENIDLFK